MRDGRRQRNDYFANQHNYWNSNDGLVLVDGGFFDFNDFDQYQFAIGNNSAAVLVSFQWFSGRECFPRSAVIDNCHCTRRNQCSTVRNHQQHYIGPECRADRFFGESFFSVCARPYQRAVSGGE